MTTEQRLRDAMQAIASPVEPGPDDWSRLQAAVAAQRRRRVREAVLATVAAAALVAGLVVVVDRDPDSSSVRVVPPATRPTAPTTTAAPRGELPPVFIACRADGTIELVATASNEVIRVLAPTRMPSGSREQVALTDDGKTAFFTQPPSAPGRDVEIFQVDLPDGPPQVIAQGRRPSPSPDGKRLAYFADIPERGPETRLVVRDLTSGEERSWNMREDRYIQEFHRVSWAPDSRHLAYEYGWESSEAIGILDTVDDTAITQAQEIPMGDLQYSYPTFQSNGELQVVAQTPPAAQDKLAELAFSAIVVVDPRTGERGRTVREYREPISWVDDPTGRHRLELRFVGAVQDYQYELRRWSDGVMTVMSTEYTDVDW